MKKIAVIITITIFIGTTAMQQFSKEDRNNVRLVIAKYLLKKNAIWLDEALVRDSSIFKLLQGKMVIKEFDNKASLHDFEAKWRYTVNLDTQEVKEETLGH